MDHELTQAEAQRVMFRYDHVHDCKRGIERWRQTKREGREGLLTRRLPWHSCEGGLGRLWGGGGVRAVISPFFSGTGGVLLVWPDNWHEGRKQLTGQHRRALSLGCIWIFDRNVWILPSITEVSKMQPLLRQLPSRV